MIERNKLKLNTKLKLKAGDQVLIKVVDYLGGDGGEFVGLVVEAANDEVTVFTPHEEFRNAAGLIKFVNYSCCGWCMVVDQFKPYDVNDPDESSNIEPHVHILRKTIHSV